MPFFAVSLTSPCTLQLCREWSEDWAEFWSSRNRRGGESYDCLHALTPCYWSDPISYIYLQTEQNRSFWERVKLCCGKQGNIKEHQFRVETFINQLPLANQAFVPKATRYKPSSSCRVAFPVSLLLLFSAINSSNHVVFDKACSLALARTVASAEKSFLNSWSTWVSGKS